MSRRFLTAILFFFPLIAVGINDPYMAESRVQMDLDNMLSRIIHREQFLVQVAAEVTTRRERQLVEGETEEAPGVPLSPRVKPMPGFVIEPTTTPPQPTKGDRKVYRMEDTFQLDLVKVDVTFDEALPPQVTYRGRALVQNYLKEHYPNRSLLSFDTLPMLKLSPELDPAEGKGTKKDPNKDEEHPAVQEKKARPPTLDERLWRYARWVALGLLMLGILILLLQVTRSDRRPSPVTKRRKPFEPSGFQPSGPGGFASAGTEKLSSFFGGFQNRGAGGSPGGDGNAPYLAELRRRLLSRFLTRSHAFRSYFQKLSAEDRGGLYIAMRGQAFDSFLDALGMKLPAAPDVEPHDLEECLATHEKNFAEFADAKDWEGRQLFGFIQELSDEQLVSLAKHQRPLVVCVMLRFMKANQSALVLESLSSEKRVEVLSQLSALEKTSFNELASIEKEVRASATHLPNQGYGGTQKQDIEFWRKILVEAQNQDAILEDIERASPELYPSLKKYKFKLEDAAALPNTLLEKVFADIDNDELGAALATCPEHVMDVLLDAVSARRRDFLQAQMKTFKSASVEETKAARTAVTKRFLDVMA